MKAIKLYPQSRTYKKEQKTTSTRNSPRFCFKSSYAMHLSTRVSFYHRFKYFVIILFFLSKNSILICDDELLAETGASLQEPRSINCRTWVFVNSKLQRRRYRHVSTLQCLHLQSPILLPLKIIELRNRWIVAFRYGSQAR